MAGPASPAGAEVSPRRRIRRWILGGAVALAAVLLAAALVLTRSEPGQEVVLETLLAETEKWLGAEVDVAGIRSRGLLSGATLVGVTVTEPGRPPAFTADSVRLRYSIRSLLGREVTVAGAEVWRPRVVVEAGSGEVASNWGRILAGAEGAQGALDAERGAPEPAGSGQAERGSQGEDAASAVRTTSLLSNLRLHDGEVVAHVPRTAGETAREMRFTGIRGHLSDLHFGPQETAIDISALSLLGEVTEEPFELADLQGRVVLRRGGLSFEAERLRLPGTEVSGSGHVTWDGGIRVDADLRAPTVASDDLGWLLPWFPSAQGGLELDMRLVPDTTVLAFSAVDLSTDDGGLGGQLTLVFSPQEVRLDGELALRELAAAVVDPWLDRSLAWPGTLSGDVRMAGVLDDLEVAGAVQVDAAGPASLFRFDGRLHLGSDLGVTDFSLAADPFHYDLLRELDPRVGVEGSGSVRIAASGRLSEGWSFSTSVVHLAPELPSSAATAVGTVQWSAGETILDVTGELDPLSLTMLAAYYPSLDVTGEVSGALSARGPLTELAVEIDLETPGGPLAATATFDVHDVARNYRAETEVRDFQISRLVPRLPQPTTVTGFFRVQGQGIRPDSVDADVGMRVTAAEVGPVVVDSARSVLRFRNGTVTVDTFRVTTSVGALSAFGTLGLADSLPGELRVSLEAETLTGVRSFFMNGPFIAADTLSALEAELLRFEGTEPDSLPLLREIAFDGRLTAGANVYGTIGNFSAGGVAQVTGFRFRDHFLAGAALEFEADGLPGTDGRLETTVRTGGFGVAGREFRSGILELDISRSEGRISAELNRTSEENYHIQASVETDSVAGVVYLDELTARFPGGRWNLGGPARLIWNREHYRLDDFSLNRPGPGGMRIEADGVLPRGSGPTDFVLLVEDLPLARFVRVAGLTGLEERNLRGVATLEVGMSGTGDAPRIVTSFTATDPGYGSVELSRVEGELDYVDHRISGYLDGWSGATKVLTVRGGLGAALELQPVPTRFPEEPVDIEVTTDALPAVILAGFLSTLEDVEGRIDGTLRLTGTPSDIRTDGELSYREGAAFLPALGVRYTDVEAEMAVSEDARVALSGIVHSGGPAEVRGLLHLRPLADPAFDLTIEGETFRAADRYDIEGVVSGAIRLTERYRRPVVEGTLYVERGTLFLDEFARYQTIVDLVDTTFFAAVDTTLLGVFPIIEEGRNPFLDNLTAEVDVEVERDTWLRSRQMDMEIDGDLRVQYDRRARRFVAVGELTAIRGSYHSFGRHFTVQEGALEFIGIPGVNPNLDIEAVARLRAGDEPLNVIANVGGTLVAPTVALTSDSPASIEESELISYLVFGRPPALLNSGESSVLSGAAGTGFTLGVGALADQLQRAVAQEIGFVDYFAISNQQAAQPTGPDPSLLGTLASTQIEIGRYLLDDVFVAVDFLPVGSANRNRTRLPGARLEWRFADQWGWEAFAEDPLLRRGVLGIQQNGPTFAHSLGLFVYREWGR